MNIEDYSFINGLLMFIGIVLWLPVLSMAIQGIPIVGVGETIVKLAITVNITQLFFVLYGMFGGLQK